MGRKAVYWLCAFLMVSLFALLCYIPDAKGAAAGDCYVTIEPSFEDGVLPVARVNIVSRSKKEYLFLPGAWESERLVLHLAQSEKDAFTLSLDGQAPVPMTDDAQRVAFNNESKAVIRRANGKIVHTLHAMRGSTIPSLFIQTESGTVGNIHKSRETREPAQMVMYGGDGAVIYRGGLNEIKARGNTTFGYSKKPYQIKLENKTDLLGTGEAKTWILLADYLDSSLMRNRITLDMARYAKMQYAIASQSVDLYINGDYKGVYLLTEKVQIDPNRVAIHDMQDELEFLNEKPLDSYPTFRETFKDGSRIGGYLLDNVPGDITGGYLLEVDKAFRIEKFSKSYVFTKHGMGVLVDEPSAVSKEQIYYLSDLINGFDRAIRQKDGIDPVSGTHYSELMDEESLAIKFLLEEISINYDAKAGSQYFYKDISGVSPKLFAGPGWDYDLTYGSLLKYTANEGYLFGMSVAFPWYNNVYQKQAQFRAKVAELYHERLRVALQILAGQVEPDGDSPLRSLREYEAEIMDSAAMNSIMWSSSTLKRYGPNLTRRFPAAINYLEKFITQRIVGLDRLIPSPH